MVRSDTASSASLPFWAGAASLTAVTLTIGLVGGAVISANLGGPLYGWPVRGIGHSAVEKYYVDSRSSAARALATATEAERPILRRIADTPAAVWLTPERHDASQVSSFVRGIVRAAGATGTIPVFVVYGIPGRDCAPTAAPGAPPGPPPGPKSGEPPLAGQSGGGSSDADYPGWVGAIATGLGSARSVVLIEPDSLALSVGCGDSEKRVSQVREDIKTLSSTGAVLYLDGGHSGWLAPSIMAGLLQRAGVSRVRGFASNVSNFNTTAAETVYDNQLSALVGGAHYVIDTSRNGSGSNGQWCNPEGRSLGSYPTAFADGRLHDANLWVKNPGESDGSCNGGPRAGVWWPKAAIELGHR